MRISRDVRILAVIVASAALFGVVDGSMWRSLLTPTLAYRPAILFGLTLVFGWRGFAWSQLIFLTAFASFLGWRGAIFITPLYLLSHACALLVARRLGGHQPWLSSERSTLSFLAAGFLAPALPAMLSDAALSLIGITVRSDVPPSIEVWLRGGAGIVALVPALLVNGSRALRHWAGLPRERETEQSITGRNLIELGVEIAVWTATLWITVQFKARYGLNVTYLTFFPPLAFTLLRGMRMATLALAANAIIATTLWSQLHWADTLPIGDLRLLIAVYSVTILVLAAVVDERQGQKAQVKELRSAQSSLRESEEYFRTLADSAPVMIWVSGPDRLCTFCNKSWLEFTGHSLNQELGDGWAAAVHPEDLDRCLAAYMACFDARRDFQSEFRIRRADGEYRWILDKGVPLYRDGQFAGYIGGCLDITDQKLFTKRLEANQARLRDAQRLARVGHWERDIETDTIEWSDQMISILGMENGTPVSFDDFLHCVHSKDRQKLVECDRRLHSSRIPIEVAYRIKQPGRKVQYVRSIMEGIRNDRDELVRIVGATHDITEKVSAEEELRRIRASLAAARDDESRRIARDLHDDITQRLALLAVALGEAVAEPIRQPEGLAVKIHAARNEILDICEGTKRISHQLHPSILDDLGLPMALESLCSDFSEHERLSVWFHCGRIPVDIPLQTRSCLYRITQEALRNVFKHANAQEVSVTLTRLGQAVQLCIVDSGAGFDASFTKLGLGLQSMRERVALVNGVLSIESNPGSGTRIVARVPLRAERKPAGRHAQVGLP